MKYSLRFALFFPSSSLIHHSSLVTLFCLVFLFGLCIFDPWHGPDEAEAATYYSKATGSWTLASTWSTTACGGAQATTAPPAGSDVIICAGNTVTTSSSVYPNNLTINSGATLNNNIGFYIAGNYTNNGTHGGTGVIYMRGNGATLDGTGTVTNAGTFYMSYAGYAYDKSINPTANLTFAGTISIYVGRTVTNNGTITVAGNIVGTSTTAKWVNADNSSVAVGGSLMTTGVLTPSGAGNTVTYNGSNAQTVETPSVNYKNLAFGGSGAKTASITAIDGNLTLSGTSSFTPSTAFTIGGDLTLSGSVAFTPSNTLAAGGNLYVGSGTTLTVGANNFSIAGATSVTGTLNHSAGTGITYNGLVTINNGGQWTNTGNVPVTFPGGLMVNSGGSFSSGSGVQTFTAGHLTNTGTITGGKFTFSGSAAQSINGAATTISTLTINNITGVTNNITTGGLTVSTALSGSGVLIQAANAILNIGGTASITTLDTSTNSGNTVNYNGVSQALRVAPYYHLTLSGIGVATGAITTVYGNLTLTGGDINYAPGANLAVGGNLIVGSGTVMDEGSTNFTVSGTTSVSGTLAHSSATGTKTHNGLVTINSGGQWTNTGNEAVTFVSGLTVLSGGSFTSGSGVQTFSGGDITNSGTFTATGGQITFSGSVAQSISSGNALTISTLRINNTTGVTNNVTGGLTVSTALTGGGKLIQPANAILNIGGTSGITTLDASTNAGNTVSFTGSGQTVPGTTFSNLTINQSGSGTATLGGAITVNGNLNITAGTLNTSVSNYSVTLKGNFTNSGTLTANNSPIILSGSGASVNIAGFNNGTGAVTFNRTANTSTFTSNVTTASLTVNGPGGTLNLGAGLTHTVTGAGDTVVNISNGALVFNTSALTLNNAGGGGVTLSGGTMNFSGTGNLNLTGNFSGGGGTFTAGTGTVTYNGAVAQAVREVTYNNLTFTNVGTKTLSGPVTVNGNLNISSGQLDTNNYVLTVKGNWTNNGTFTARSGTVTFNGTGAQTISGSTAWYGLTITASAARTVSFQSGATQTVSAGGALIFTGISSGQKLTLAPTGGSSWLLNVNPTATQSVSYVSVSYSNAGGGATIEAGAGANTNAGNNTNWIFTGTSITVGTAGSQTVYMRASSADNYAGGAFTFVMDYNSTDVTQIKLSKTGTISDANLFDVKLFYKQESACSASIPADAAAFNAVGAGFTSGTATVNGGPMTVGTGNVCLYVQLDLGPAARGQTFDIRIANPSTDVTVSKGAVTPATAIDIPGTTTVDTPPSLTSDAVSPSSGDTTIPYTFTVVYTDENNDAPASGYPAIFIGDSDGYFGHVMDLDTGAAAGLHDGDYSNGEQYKYTANLGAATYLRYYFEAGAEGWVQTVTRLPLIGDNPNYRSGVSVHLMSSGQNIVGIPKNLGVGKAYSSILRDDTEYAYCRTYVPAGLFTGEYADCRSGNIETGKGYFIYTLRGTSSVDEKDAGVTDLAGNVVDPFYDISLQKGWNIVSNPYNERISLQGSSGPRCTVVRDGVESADYDSAVALGWVSNSIYEYIAGTTNYAGYAYNDDPTPAVLEPWKGYWIFVSDSSFISSMKLRVYQ